MKTFKLLMIGMMLIFAASVQSQLSVNVHIGSPPAWAPEGNSGVRYYYLPDVEAYYDVQTSMFIYYSGNQWIRRAYLPSRYRGYDLYHGYKVVMRDYHGNSPYSDFRQHKMKFPHGYRGGEQHAVGKPNEKHDNGERPHSNYNPKPQNHHTVYRNHDNGKDRNEGNGNKNDRKNDRREDKKEGHDNGNRK